MLKIELHYFPSIGYFQQLLQHKKVCFSPELPFKRSTFRNRMMVAGPAGPLTLSIPVVGGRSIQLSYSQVMIDHRSNWQRDHFRTLASVYGRSPFFFHYRPELEALFEEAHPTLFSWNLACLLWVIGKMKRKENIQFVEHCPPLENSPGTIDLTDFFHPKNSHTADKGPFPTYPQVFGDRSGFLPNLSILDLLFNLGPDAVQKIDRFE